MNKFSYYKNGITQTIPDKEVDIKEIAGLIHINKALLNKTIKLRSIKDKESKGKFKASLPYCTFSGTFSTRSNDSLIKHSGYICVDLDHIGSNGEITTLKTQISEYYAPALMFISPSGDGLKLIFAIDVNEGTHLQYFTALETFFKTQFSLSIDAACKDVSRACFLCNDPDMFCDKTPDILNKEFISKGEITILPVIKPADESLSYEAAKKWTDSRITFIEGSRNQYITALADTCNRYGIPEHTILLNMEEFSSPDFTIKEIEATVKSRYAHVEWFGTAGSIIQPVGKDNPYIRVGVSYYKIIKKVDRHGIERKELKVWNKDTLIQDFKRNFLKTIPHYDDFVMYPNNVNLQPVVKNCYNLYSEFRHIPAPGEWLWTERLLKHVFGEQYDLGIRYMQILYLHPDRSTVILAIVSKERMTGKTTFLNWINMLFGANVALISSTDFLSGFNSHYATKNIIAIEETLFDKKLTIEKLKALATAKYIQINEKFVQQYKIPFYGKIILTSNNEEKFAQIDDEEVRFFVRKIGTPEFTNHAIETNLLEEIPAFLYHLNSLPAVDWSISRSGFTGKELVNKFLYAVVKESKSSLAKTLEIYITEFFDNCKHESFLATPSDLKQKWFYTNNNYGVDYISSVLRNEFNMNTEKLQRYEFLNDATETTKVGRPYCFYRKDFIND